MDNELHYLTYDPDAIMEEMLTTYMAVGGDSIMPGDEKYMLLQGVLQMFVQSFAGIDNALRMATLRYAVRDYLDLIGENRDCERIEAVAASASATFSLSATGSAYTIPAGTALTADGVLLWVTDEDIEATGSAETATVGITCSEVGTKGNALAAGTQLQMVAPMSGVGTIVVATASGGGQDREEDDAYRERIRQHGLANNTAGPSGQYEGIASAVSSLIVDVNAVNGGSGVVNVWLLLSDTSTSAAVIADVVAALNDADVRPLTDTVNVALATDVSYTLDVTCTVESGVTQSALEAAVEDYQAWQDESIGLAFNPDRLKALLYQAGASLVTFENTSTFNGGAAVYTEIAANERCAGTVNLVVSGT